MKLLKILFINVVTPLLLVTSLAANAGSYGKKKDIVDIAASNSDFSTLVAAVKAAGLVDTLKSNGPFTVFAPTNAAFAKLPAGTVESLLEPENKDKLISILTYHVVPGKVYAKQVLSLSDATTVEGSKIAINTANGKVMIDNAEVVKTDIKAKNGVIHVIDSVILPGTGQKTAMN
jgi:uncharacterized surface protein with fasciclin (FAS1) repeats